MCESHKANTGWNDALEALGIVSLVFSCLFMAELLASIWAFGLSYVEIYLGSCMSIAYLHFRHSYFNSKFHCLDAVVIIASFIVDLLLRGPLEEVATLVIVLRLWRVFKIIEELTAGAKEQLERLKEQIETLEHENAELREEVRKLRVD